MQFVTAIDEAYLPGLIALNNSFKANAGDGVSLSCMVYGDSELVKKVESLGIDVIENFDIPAYLPVSEHWPVASPAMYARLMVPLLYESPCAWIDADCIVLKPLSILGDMKFSNPVAGVVTSTSQIGQQVKGNLDVNGSLPAIFAGLLVYNVEVWRKKRITEQCFEIMNSRRDLEFLYAVQSVMSYVLKGDFYHLDYSWQEFANRGKLSANCRIVHYVGALPWRDDMKNKDIFNQYA